MFLRARCSSLARAQSSAHRLLHERAAPCLFGGRQLLQREGDRPQGAFVEVRRVAEAERRVPRVELLRALEEADDLAVLGIRGHPVPESRREGWRAGGDDRMEPLAQGAIRFRHLGDLREHGAFPVRLVLARAAARCRLQLLDTLLHRDSFLFRESLGRLADRGGALGGPLRALLCSFHGHASARSSASRSHAIFAPAAALSLTIAANTLAAGALKVCSRTNSRSEMTRAVAWVFMGSLPLQNLCCCSSQSAAVLYRRDRPSGDEVLESRQRKTRVVPVTISQTDQRM